MHASDEVNNNIFINYASIDASTISIIVLIMKIGIEDHVNILIKIRVLFF